MATKEHSREEIIQILKELDAEGKQPGRSGLRRKGINEYWTAKLIPEGLTELKRKLGIKLSPQERHSSEDELLEKIDAVVSKLKRIPSWAMLRRETGVTDKTFLSRFGNSGITEIFRRYRGWLKKHKPTSGNIKLVDAYLEGRSEDTGPAVQRRGKKRSVRRKWKKVSGRVYGAPMDFGNLIYEPTNEQGVVFLFGMVSKHLGFSIEYLGPDFPDCEAKRYIDGRRGGGQQPVRIEFEYRSRDFKHNADGCDLIVCWEDNWGSDCPLEVLELRSEIEKLRRTPDFSRK